MLLLIKFLELQINVMEAVNFILSITAIITFIFMYNREQKRKVDSDDLKDLKGYVDQQDRSLHHRIDGVEKKIAEDIGSMRDQVNAIYNYLLGGRK